MTRPLQSFPSVSLVLAILVSTGGCAAHRRATDPGYQVRLSVAQQLASHGDWAAAYRAADALCKEAPDGPARLLRARALRHTGAAAEAEAALRALLVDEPRNGVAHAELAVLCDRAGRGEEALAHHRAALRLDPGSARYLNNLGFALHLRGRPGESVPLYEEALRVDPTDARVRNNLGFALAATGDFPGAARQFALAGTRAQARNNLGLAYERAGNLLQAYEQYLEAVQLDASSGTARGNLEHVAHELGRVLPDLGTVPDPDVKGGS